MKEFANIIRLFPVSSLQNELDRPWLNDSNAGVKLISVDKVLLEPEVETSESGSLHILNSTLNIATPAALTCMTYQMPVKCVVVIRDSDNGIYQLGDKHNPVHVFIRKNINYSKLILDAKLLKNPFL